MRLFSLLLLTLIAVQILPQARAQDNLLMFSNSITVQGVRPYLADLVEEASMPRPAITVINGGATTTNYVNNSGAITSTLPAGQTWRAMVIQGGTVETTSFMGNPAAFVPNMLSLAGTLYAHSPNAQFVGHETGADHPTNSSVYPAWFPDPETWLAFPQAAYAAAQAAIIAANPTALPARTAQQGTLFAKTAGYELALYDPDLHHLSRQGKIVTACLYFLEIYGGKVCDLPVDYSSGSPLVTRLQNHGISEADWWKLAGYADRIQLQSERSYPGSDSDFQLRSAVNLSVDNLCTTKSATAGDGLTVSMVSPLGAADSYAATCFIQVLALGVSPVGGSFPGFHLDRPLVSPLFSMVDLQAPTLVRSVPPGLAGQVLWLQAVSTMPSPDPAYPFVVSDAQRIEIQ